MLSTPSFISTLNARDPYSKSSSRFMPASSHRRFVIALHSPPVLVVTGLRFCCPEKTLQRCRTAFGRSLSLVQFAGAESGNLGVFSQLLEQLGRVSLRSRLYGGGSSLERTVLCPNSL